MFLLFTAHCSRQELPKQPPLNASVQASVRVEHAQQTRIMLLHTTATLISVPAAAGAPAAVAIAPAMLLLTTAAAAAAAAA
jgi:hypothetical protein